MNGYQAVSVWTLLPTPDLPESVKNESSKQYLSRVELLWLDHLMRALGVTLLNKYATLDRLSLIVQEDEILSTSNAEVCPLFPSPDDEWVREISVLGKGMYGKTYRVRLDGACWRAIDPRWADLNEHLTYEIPAVVKQSTGYQPVDRYQNTLQEILINQLVLRPTLLHSNVPSHFPLMYSFIACEPNKDKSSPHFCTDHPTISFDDLNLRQRDAKLRDGTLELFPVFEKVDGVTLDHVMKQAAFDPDDVDLLSNWLLQIFATLDVINQRVMYAHNDLHVENVMVMPTRAPSFVYTNADGTRRTIEPMMRVVMIDQGLAGGSFSHRGETFLAYYQLSSTVGHQGCMMVSDIFRVFRSLWVEWPANTFGHLLLHQMITRLFGDEVIDYIETRVSSFDTWLEYVIFLLHHLKIDRFQSITGLTHHDVLAQLDQSIEEVRALRTDYSSPRVQRIVQRRVEKHLSSGTDGKKERKLAARLERFLQHPNASSGHRLERALDRIHQKMRLEGRGCDCLPHLTNKKLLLSPYK